MIRTISLISAAMFGAFTLSGCDTPASATGGVVNKPVASVSGRVMANPQPKSPSVKTASYSKSSTTSSPRATPKTKKKEAVNPSVTTRASSKRGPVDTTQRAAVTDQATKSDRVTVKLHD